MPQLATCCLTLWEAEEQSALALRLPFAMVRALVQSGALPSAKALGVYEALVTEFLPEWRDHARGLARAEVSRIG